MVLLAIVLLNLVDCALVLGELILDIHYIKGLVEDMDETSQAFIDKMEHKYPQYLYDNNVENIDSLFDKIYEANCTFNNSNDQFFEDEFGWRLTASTTIPSTTIQMRNTPADFWLRKKRDVRWPKHGKRGQEDLVGHGNNVTDHVTPSGHNLPHAHSIYEDIAHGLHKASIAILGVLFLENVLKIFFMGKRFFHHKLEVFDAVVVGASFALDLVFIRGLTVYRIQDGILILSFMVPWRVIRVVNSLIVAVLDNEHFRLKMMYKRQKTVTAELRDMKNLVKDLQLHLKKIERFCINEGIPQWKVNQHIHFYRNASAISSMASYALGSMLSGLLTDNPSTNGHLGSAGQKEPMANKGVLKAKISGQSFESRRDSGRGSIQDEHDQYQCRSEFDKISTTSNGVSDMIDGHYDGNIKMDNIHTEPTHNDHEKNHVNAPTRM